MNREPLKRAWESASRPLYNHTILILTVVFCIGQIVILWYFSRLSSQLIRRAAVQGTQHYSEALAEFRTLYTSEVVERVRVHGIEVTHDYARKSAAIPLPATLSILLGEAIGKRGSGMQVRLYSDHPFPWRTEGGPRDEFERQALVRIRETPADPYSLFEEVGGRASLRYATADLMRPSCVNCHNSHPDSPKRDWKVGDVRGILEVIRPLDLVEAQTRRDLRGTYALAGLSSLLWLGGLAVAVGKLRRTSVDLEHKVEERTRELARTNAELQQFAYVASHDLKAPLRAIQSLSAWIEEDLKGSLAGDSQKNMDLLRGRARRMERLIDDLLQYSRAGREERRIETVHTDALIRQLVDLISPRAGITVEIAPELPVIETVRTPLEHVFVNLIGNAVKHHDRAEGRIRVTSRDVGDRHEFCVSDDGPGIAPEFHEKVFQMFQTLKPRDVVEGSGIGLAVVKKIVETYGGTIQIESAPGQGASFRFTWPKSISEA